MRIDKEAREVVHQKTLAFANDLLIESERIARRHQTETVGAAYVETAVDHLYLHPRSAGLADVLLSIGCALFGVASGVFASVALGAHPVGRWVVPLAVAVSILSAGGIGVGVARKTMR